MDNHTAKAESPPSERLLWAPWRLEYIRGIKDSDCFICDKRDDRNDDDRNLVLARGQESFLLLNAFPYNSGHVLVAPYRPRWIGDTNFMPVIGDTRVVPEALTDTARRLREAWEKEG